MKITTHIDLPNKHSIELYYIKKTDGSPNKMVLYYTHSDSIIESLVFHDVGDDTIRPGHITWLSQNDVDAMISYPPNSSRGATSPTVDE